MDNETVKQDLYQAIHEFLQLDQTADNETISTSFAPIKVFADELPVYPNPQTQAEVNAYDLAHQASDADLLYFSAIESVTDSIGERDATLSRLQARAKEIERILRADS
ncbi:hypothetical protein [Spirosoma endophyticum]|uniref:Uncharacterized protein n=1 Tax=Spirosoma endophyticum TaxID=662367 RepID=A0A1I2H3S6_9BACT|nr:hypothetical protein [Spirosoma endophyticum]SFF24884.1 hypothetical protein SAMN05216167_13816 [Spirosoma endophyticum]